MHYLSKRNSILFFISVICLFILSFSILALASNGSEYIWTGGFPASDVSDLRFIMSGGNSNYQQNVIKAGCEAWNGISSKVKVSFDTSGAKVSVYKKTTHINPYLCGLTTHYYRDALGALMEDINFTNTWECVDIEGYDTNMNNIGITSDSDKKLIYMHEMGHALSLKHNDSSMYLIMNTETKNTIRAGGILYDDKANLKLRWGN